jgi:3-isopropylmalate/(R)-2-methylmalate dehydratase small subunit
VEKFTQHTGTGLPLRRSNVDTDQIIPAVYLKRVTRTGFEDGLFAAWRKDPEFVANQPQYDGATVLVAGPDFGTGSSREHAVWALMDYGFKVVISSRFADIFRGNSGKAGLVAAQVTQDVVEQLWKLIENEPTTQIVVDLEQRPGRCAHRAVPDRRLHAVAAARGPRRHRHHALARGRHRRLRGDPAVLETGDAVGLPVPSRSPGRARIAEFSQRCKGKR